MNALEIITGIIVALGGVSIIPKAIEGWKAWRNGRAREEKEQNRTALGRMVEAEKRAREEMFWSYTLQEYAARLRLMLVQLGVPENKLPEWPAKPAREPANSKG